MKGRPRFTRLMWGLMLSLMVVTTVHAARTESIAIALTVRGTAELKQGADEWAPLAFGAVLNDSDEVRTGEDGFIALAFTDDGSQIKIRPNASVMLSAQRGEGPDLAKKVVLQVGEVLSDVKRQKGSMEVQTPTSVASVKGTQFWTIVDGSGGTTVITLEGLVDLFNMISGTSVPVPEGQYATSSASGRVTARPMSPAVTVPTFDPDAEPTPEPESVEPGESDQPTTPGVGGPGEGAPTEDEEGEGETEGGGLGIGGAVGATVLDGQNYQYISLRPEIPLGKFGIGLDLPFYFDSDGNLREDDWNFDSADDVINKIYYLRYGKPGDPTYVRVGALDNITLGFGMIMNRYSNAIEWPQVRRIGLHAQKKIGAFGLEAVVNNFNEISDPGVVGLRGTFEMKLGLPIVFGATAVMDGNMYLGAKDADDDGVPDQLDQFPDLNDSDEITRLFGLGLTQTQLDELIAGGYLPDIMNPAANFGDSTASSLIYGVDVGIPILRKDAMQLWIYGQAAMIQDYGMGITAPGLKFQLGPFHLGAEYRIFGKEFMPEFFNYSYEIERVVWSEADSTYLTKAAQLADLPAASGYFVDAGLSLMNFFDFYAAYQAMQYEEVIDETTGDPIVFPDKMFYASASINAEAIPKLGLAEAYYHQPRAENITEATDGTTWGYRLGYELGGGFMLVWDNKSIYQNEEWTKVMTVETQFTF